jgi:hypothetical protein
MTKRFLCQALVGALLVSLANSLPPVFAQNASLEEEEEEGEEEEVSVPSTSGTSTAKPQESAATLSTIGPPAAYPERAKINALIQQARDKGIGVSTYVVAERSISDKLTSGESSEKVQPLIANLVNRLTDQLKQSQILKSQKPIPEDDFVRDSQGKLLLQCGKPQHYTKEGLASHKKEVARLKAQSESNSPAALEQQGWNQRRSDQAAQSRSSSNAANRAQNDAWRQRSIFGR